MTNKLVVIINSLKVPKIKKILLYEMKFLVPNHSCLQNPWLGGYRPQIPVLSGLCPQLNLLNPPPRTKFLGTPLLTFPGILRKNAMTLGWPPVLNLDLPRMRPERILCASGVMGQTDYSWVRHWLTGFTRTRADFEGTRCASKEQRWLHDKATARTSEEQWLFL